MTSTRTQQIAHDAVTGEQYETARPGNAVDRAEAWTQLAREAHEECVKEEAAETELQRRRNAPGQ